MAINPLGAAGPANIAGAGSASPIKESFGKVIKGASAQGRVEPPSTPNTPPQQQAQSVSSAKAGTTRVEAAHQSKALEPAAKVLDHVSAAQARMDQVLKIAESGKSFSPAELLSLQAHIYRASQELDLAGKVVEKSTAGVKQVLQTQV